MSWSISLAGHVDTAEEEQAVIDAVRTAVESIPSVNYAWMGTQFHDQINLMAPPGPMKDEEEAQADAETPHIPDSAPEPPPASGAKRAPVRKR